MSTRERKVFTEEFKRDVINLVRVGDRKTTEIARDLGLRVELIYRWVQQSHLQQETEAQEMDSKLELKRLRKRLADVEEERDILKKAVGIFTRSEKSASNS
ncbi:MAG: transposase [Ignavibacteriaceae bacterium]|nr:transposase [Ignavibacteriaceae bacterium]